MVECKNAFVQVNGPPEREISAVSQSFKEILQDQMETITNLKIENSKLVDKAKKDETAFQSS